ncbi:hypothetical protein [Leuconostoc pseudomesenteroides]|uniref:hypothetical protein n=1 Tax=Leuconostoc pseudomesenteroides TaxID=33968 RepID=UPI0039EC59C8
MTEPVAYRFKRNGINWVYQENEPKINWDIIEPLYTAEQLHPRVKMTQKQYDRLMWDKENTDLLTCLGYFLEHDGVNKFGLPSENLMGFLKQEDIARAWLNPEETIEIVPTMKWFVRSKKSDKDGYYWWLTYNSVNFVPDYTPYKNVSSLVKGFDTKEEAELWTNPKTEAVYLPVEEK